MLAVTVDEQRKFQLHELARQVSDSALQKLAFDREREQVRAALQALQSTSPEALRA